MEVMEITKKRARQSQGQQVRMNRPRKMSLVLTQPKSKAFKKDPHLSAFQGKDAPERKYVDTQTAGAVEFSTTGTVLLLNGVAQGMGMLAGNGPT